jgi:signal transduction histidine kinase
MTALAWTVLGQVSHTSAERERAAIWETHSIQVQLQTQLLLAAVEAAETGQRGYLLSGEHRYLDPYDEGAAVAQSRMDELQRLTADNPAQQARLAEVERLMRERLDLLATVLTAAEHGRRADAVRLVREGRGREVMDKLRAELDVVWRDESRLLGKRRAASQRAIAAERRSSQMVAILAAGLILALLGLALSAVGARKETLKKANELEVSRRVRDELEVRIAEAIEAQRRSEAALRQSQKMEAIGQLAGGIAHDFNNMLAVIIGSIEIAQRRLAEGQPDIGRYLSNAMDGARRAASLTQRILAFSRQQPLAPKVVNINRLVSDMSELLHRTLGEQIKLETVLASGLWTTNVDAHQLESILLNLAVNARDAMPEGGSLTVETGNAYLDDAYVALHDGIKSGQYVYVAVTDTGAGMAPDIIARAFDPFFTTKPVGKGTGLGLSQVFGFVKQSGGHIKIYSEVGQGTCVKAYLPRWVGDRPADEPVRRVAEIPRGDAAELVLVVEDDDRVRAVSVEALRDLGYTVQHASNAREALERLAATPAITLLFTDIVMPDMNGRQWAAEARTRAPRLKVLYTTGYTRNSIVHNGILDADVAFLPKPFSLDQLAAKVREVLDS